MAKKNKKKVNVVYSTNPDYSYEYDNGHEEDTLSPEEQHLKLMIDRKQRKGKSAVIITGFIGTEDDLKDLCKNIKMKCGVGGSAKDGEIIIQGDNRKKVAEVLEKEGYNVKLAGG